MLDDDARQWLADLLGPAVKFDEPLARHTTFRIGGPADVLAEPENESQLRQVIKWTRQNEIPYWVLGGGSNLLVRDGGIRGVVIRLGSMTGNIQWTAKQSRVDVSAGAGVPIKRLCALAIRNGWQGMNFALGIPGTLGGAILMNAGTAHGSLADVLSAVTVMTADGEKMRYKQEQLKFQYRSLAWPDPVHNEAQPFIILTAEVRLALADRDQIRKQARLLMLARTRRQPKWQPSAGSFFKNPSADMPAGRLIDEAGLKGLRVGDAQVSMKHANFIVNRGNATAAQVLRLADRVKEKVKADYGIELQSEVRIVGQETGKKKPL